MNVVEFDQATVKVGSRAVLSEISIAIKPGEFVGVLGPNGAGKTTLMQTILGLIEPHDGTVRVFAKPPQRGNPAIGYCPDSAPFNLTCGCAASILSRVRCAANVGAFRFYHGPTAA